MGDILNSINSPEDLKCLQKSEISGLCSEIREFLVDKVEKSGGHLASNLGVVELSVALHRVFNSPNDKIIFDVGHQGYVHKMLTGRKDLFDTLRTPGGLSGFTTRREGEHDPFGAGHSSTALSAALGFAEASYLNGDDNYAVCIVGDGACTGGMFHEALNNCKPDLKLILIINENRMSISKNKGAFASYLAKVRISKGYTGWKRGTRSFLSKIPLIGEPIHRFLSFVKNKIKRIIYSTNYFEDLGLYYIGPVDGNNYAATERALSEAKMLGKTCVVHLYTKKGKGYKPAETSPDSFHSVASSEKKSSFHEEFAKNLVKIAEADKDVVAVTAAMGIGTGLDIFEKKFKDRYFDVGIAEAHALTFSAGLSAAGKKPFVAIYSTFLQRGYDNIIHDICLQELPVKLMIDRAGLAIQDGATHHGIFDVSMLYNIPKIGLVAPITYDGLELACRLAQNSDYPFAVRYPNASESKLLRCEFFKDSVSLEPKCNYIDGQNNSLVFISYGNITEEAVFAAERLSSSGITCGVILCQKLKGYEDETIRFIEDHTGDNCHLIFVEEGIKNGGFSMNLKNRIENHNPERRIEICAIDDHFVIPDHPVNIYEYTGIGRDALYAKALRILENDNKT